MAIIAFFKRLKLGVHKGMGEVLTQGQVSKSFLKLLTDPELEPGQFPGRHAQQDVGGLSARSEADLVVKLLVVFLSNKSWVWYCVGFEL